MELYTNIVLTVIVLAGLLSTAVLMFCASKFITLMQRFDGFVLPPDDKTPSQLAQTIESASHIVGKAAAVEIKTTLMGKISGEVRQTQAVEGAIAQDALQARFPMLSGLPGLNKLVKKNPGLLEVAISLLGSRIPQGIVNPPGSNGNPDTNKVRFRF